MRNSLHFRIKPLYGLADNDFAKSMKGVFDMLFIFFRTGHGKSPFLKGLCMVDWLDWLCYLPLRKIREIFLQQFSQLSNMDSVYK